MIYLNSLRILCISEVQGEGVKMVKPSNIRVADENIPVWSEKKVAQDRLNTGLYSGEVVKVKAPGNTKFSFRRNRKDFKSKTGYGIVPVRASSRARSHTRRPPRRRN